MGPAGELDLPSTNEHRAYVPKVFNRMKGAPPHLLMVPYPAQPHILPMLNLARQLVSHGGLKITYVCHQKLINRLLEKQSNSSDAIHFVGVPDKLPGFEVPSDLPATPKVLQESLELGHCMGPFVDQLLRDQDSLQGPTCMITDMIHWWSIEIAVKLGIPRYALAPTAAACVQLTLYAYPDGIVFGDNGSLKEIPGLPPLQKHHVLAFCLSDYEYRKAFLTKWPKSILESDGVVMNTCLVLESQVIDAIRDTLPHEVPLLAVGPLGLSPELFSKGVSLEGLQLSDEKLVINWLDEQPPLSVLYVGFGTTGNWFFSKKHVTELARGLEASGQRFLWVFRAPRGVDEDDPELLPPGFEERVRGRGFMIRKSWAPQLQILAHPSTGAFLSSNGWNSAIESLTLGVPVIGWPSEYDKPMISRLIESTWKVGITLPYRQDFFVEAEEFVNAINVVLQSEEGKAMRQRMEKYKTSIGASVAPGGSSYEAVVEFVNLIKGGFKPT